MGEEDLVGELKLSMYGTRDAAQNWQETLSAHLMAAGFARGRINPCLFHHPGRGLRTVVHGDDYTTVGAPEALRWLKGELEKKYELNTNVIGTGVGAAREGRVSTELSVSLPRASNMRPTSDMASEWWQSLVCRTAER